MTFSSIMTFLCVVYVLAYGGMIAYDLFFSKEGVELTPVFEEEEIDISDEAQAFTPTLVMKDDPPPEEEEESKAEDTVPEGPAPDDMVTLTGGIEINDLRPKLEELSINGKNSVLGAVLNDWYEYSDVA